MRIKHRINEGVVEVGEELGAHLIESGLWEELKPTRAKRAAKPPAAAEV